MEAKFNELPWHDAELLNIDIDRRKPGENDQIIIDVCWPEGEKGKLIFKDCYELEVTMNFGILAPESIMDASYTEDSQQIRDIREKWELVGVDLGRLKCFEIRTNSTASVLRIYALSCSLQ